ncbi:RNA polymerase sigma factor [Actinomadura alba]|uniref:Sigma-70 family RNA polymerase sigma factor n=1 Tax=Actinomadura alba TaxID=406431 RepID=A0ABR7LPY6_9ACTN|nr:sigma-70 family RNA polymerase sigma factor [Actinomadura alba]MBC6466881.1 sigma-70 family RNA polymerase sigma factor [Actinomadura alba]
MAEPDPRERFTVLYDTYHPRVHAYAVSRAGRQLAEEVTSETFCVAWRRFGDLPDPPLPWLLGVARNVLRESFRAQVRQDSLTAELRAWTSAAEAAHGDVGDAVVERATVLQALAGLSEDDRELLTLVAWHGLSPREAAKVVGCSTATYFVRLHRARKRLERALSGAAPAARVHHSAAHVSALTSGRGSTR